MPAPFFFLCYSAAGALVFGIERGGLAEVLLSSVGYGHFTTEHVFGHHRFVGTQNDPATARFGETFYAFLPRTVFAGARYARS